VVLRESPVIVLENVPIPEPFVVLVVRETVGPVVVLHTTPRAVTGLPPVDVTVPPLDAPEAVIELTLVAVVTAGRLTTSTVSVVEEEP
jgi:hypothetical protein